MANFNLPSSVFAQYKQISFFSQPLRKDILRGCISIFAGLLIWEILARLLLENELLIPPPSSVLRAFWRLAVSGQLNKHFAATLLEFTYGFATATIQPGGGTGAEPYTHDSDEEVVVVLSGVLDLWVGDEHYVLREGDAITFPSRLPHWNMNQGDVPVTVLFCLTPPSF